MSDDSYVTPEECDAYVTGVLGDIKVSLKEEDDAYVQGVLRKKPVQFTVNWPAPSAGAFGPASPLVPDVRSFRHVFASVRFIGLDWFAESYRFDGRVTPTYGTDPETGNTTLELAVKPVTPVHRVPAERWRRAGYRLLRLFRADD